MNAKRYSLLLGMVILLFCASCYKEGDLDALKNLAKGSKVLRLIYYLPAVSSAVAINIIWRYIFDMDYGILNVMFGTNVPWLGTSNKWLIRIAIMIKNIYRFIDENYFVLFTSTSAVNQTNVFLWYSP